MNKTLPARLSKLAPPAALTALLVLPLASQAMDFGGIVKLGYDFGGEKMVSATLVSTSGSTTNQAIYANSGLVLAGGVSMLNDAKNFSMDATIGWKSDSINASNQDFEFTRYPLDVLAFYNLPLGEKGRTRMRFGGGLTYHLNPQFSASGSLANGKVDFDNALGFVAQIDAVMGRGGSGLNFGLRFTSVNYEADGVESIRGNGAGLFVGGIF
jgi:hypothetical protein